MFKCFWTPGACSRFELEKQLHEQYAINNNANTKTFVSFIVALFALFGFYGYIFVFSDFSFSTNGHFVREVDGIRLFSLEVFYLMAFVVNGILFFLSILALNLGHGQRRDHIINHNIRKKYYMTEGGDSDAAYGKVFGTEYNPSDKSYWTFLPGYFNIFYWLFFTGQVFVVLTSLLKISVNMNQHYSVWNTWGLLAIIVLMLQTAMICYTLCFRCKIYGKYKKAVSNKKK